MKTQTRLVRILSLVVIASVTSIARAAPRHKKAHHTTQTPVPDSEPVVNDPEGPFAPAGKTGKLKDDEPPPPIKPEETATEEPAPAQAKMGSVGVDMVFGIGTTGAGTQVVDQKVASFLVGGTYRVGTNVGFRLRMPFATGQITAVEDPKYNATSIGNVEIAAAYIAPLGTHAELPVELALALPTASGDLFAPPDDLGRRRHYRVNSAAQFARGFEEDALFATHRFGVVPAVRFRYQRGALQTGAFVKVPILIRVGGEPPPVDSILTVNSLVVETVVGADFYYGVVADTLDLGARAWLAYLSSEAINLNLPGQVPPPKTQFVVEPSVRGSFGSVRTALGFLWPIRGRLGSDPQIYGARLDVGYVF